ncbi:unnamed protein product, partial [Adineta steineri]
YLSPAVKEKPKPVERRWIPPSPYKHERPTSLSPEKKVEERKYCCNESGGAL